MIREGHSALTTFRYTSGHGVANITFENPPVNAISGVMMQELRAVLAGLRDDSSTRVIVFRSADPIFFLVHVDMEILEQADVLKHLAAATPPGLSIFQAVGELLRSQPQVTIVELAGTARGGGAEFVAASDMAFAAAETGGLGQIGALMGIVPSGGGTQYLAERVGRNRALEVVLTGELWDAKSAAAYGWINRAMPAAELAAFDGVAAAAKRVLAVPPPMAGYRREEEEWSALIARPATAQLMAEALRLGAQTVSGEQQLEDLMRQASSAGSRSVEE